jgi:hypothetical protein
MTHKEGEKPDLHSFFNEGYLGSKKAELDHLMGSVLIVAINSFFIKLSKSREEYKDEFITRVEKAKELPDYGQVDEGTLVEVVQKAQETDWNDQAALKKLNAELGQL